jgi:NADPH:quinone reductase-like Zn-dependent oxidoreductase
VVNAPMVLGHEASGFVAKVGSAVQNLQAGPLNSYFVELFLFVSRGLQKDVVYILAGQ